MTVRKRGHWHFDYLSASVLGGVLAGLEGSPFGDHYYVDPTNGAAGNSGTHPSAAKATLAQALALCTAYKGDVIHVAKGTQTVTEPVEIDKYGVVILADQIVNPYANGEYHTIYGSHTDGPAAIIKAPAIIAGMGFVGSQVAGPSLLSDCEEQGGYEGGAAWLYQCRFSQWGIAKAYAFQQIGGNLNILEDCIFEGLFAGWATAPVSLQNDTGGFAPYETIIRRCKFFASGNGIYCIEFASGSVPNQVLIEENVNICGPSMASKFLNTNGVTGTGSIIGNYTGGATDTGSYDVAVSTLQTNGFNVANNHYEES